MTTTYLPINSEALHLVYAQAQAVHPDTSKGRGRAIRAAYEWLMERWADGGTMALEGGALLVESATTPERMYRAGANGCTCPAAAVCWHYEAYMLVKAMQRRQVALLGARMRAGRVYREVAELYS